MKLILDFLPLVLFFGAYKLYSIYVATGVLMAATALQMLYLYKTEGKLQTMHKVTLAMVLGFGMLTILLQDERFIKWKPTVLYAAIGLALLIAVSFWKKNLIQTFLGAQLNLPNEVWTKLNLAWIAYAFFMAALNAFVVLYYSTDQWVSFKVWGFVFPLIFIVLQGFYVAKYLQNDPPN